MMAISLPSSSVLPAQGTAPAQHNETALSGLVRVMNTVTSPYKGFCDDHSVPLRTSLYFALGATACKFLPPGVSQAASAACAMLATPPGDIRKLACPLNSVVSLLPAGVNTLASAALGYFMGTYAQQQCQEMTDWLQAILDIKHAYPHYADLEFYSATGQDDLNEHRERKRLFCALVTEAENINIRDFSSVQALFRKHEVIISRLIDECASKAGFLCEAADEAIAGIKQTFPHDKIIFPDETVKDEITELAFSKLFNLPVTLAQFSYCVSSLNAQRRVGLGIVYLDGKGTKAFMKLHHPDVKGGTERYTDALEASLIALFCGDYVVDIFDVIRLTGIDITLLAGGVEGHHPEGWSPDNVLSLPVMAHEFSRSRASPSRTDETVFEQQTAPVLRQRKPKKLPTVITAQTPQPRPDIISMPGPVIRIGWSDVFRRQYETLSSREKQNISKIENDIRNSCQDNGPPHYQGAYEVTRNYIIYNAVLTEGKGKGKYRLYVEIKGNGEYELKWIVNPHTIPYRFL